MKREIKVGDLVRIPGPRSHRRCFGHNLPQGAVLEVARVIGGKLGSLGFKHPLYGYEQLVGTDRAKVAKQAMNKREQYSERRG